MDKARQIHRPSPAASVLVWVLLFGCTTEDAVERTDPFTGEKSYSTTLWSSEKKTTTVTHEEIKKAAEEPK
jgi:hypothetical protein